MIKPVTQIVANKASTSLSENLRIGREVLSEFKTDYPKLKSCRLLLAKMLSIRDWDKFDDLMPPFVEQLASYNNGLKVVRARLEELPKNNFSEYCDSYEKIVREEGYANCREMAFIVGNRLTKRAIDTQNISMRLWRNKEEYADHAFSVIGIKKGAIVEDYQTWGDEAVVVDAWYCRGFAKAAIEALKKYAKLFEMKQEDNLYFIPRNYNE